jgi:hypothetical protein
MSVQTPLRNVAAILPAPELHHHPGAPRFRYIQDERYASASCGGHAVSVEAPGSRERTAGTPHHCGAMPLVALPFVDGRKSIYAHVRLLLAEFHAVGVLYGHRQPPR